MRGLGRTEGLDCGTVVLDGAKFIVSDCTISINPDVALNLQKVRNQAMVYCSLQKAWPSHSEQLIPVQGNQTFMFISC